MRKTKMMASFTITCIDENENLYIYKGGSDAKRTASMSVAIKSMPGLPDELREKIYLIRNIPYICLYSESDSFFNRLSYSTTSY
jgi:hypothetical protein